MFIAEDNEPSIDGNNNKWVGEDSPAKIDTGILTQSESRERLAQVVEGG